MVFSSDTFSETPAPAGLAKADNGAAGTAPGENGYGRPSWHPDPAVRPMARGALPEASGSMRAVRPEAMARAAGIAPGEDKAAVVVADLAKGSRRHPASGRFIPGEIAAGHPSLDQQPHGGDGRRNGPGAGVPQPVTATPPDPHHVAGGPRSEQLAHPPGSRTVERLDLAAACSPRFAGQLARPVNPDPMGHILASPLEHLGSTPVARQLSTDDIPSGPPVLAAQWDGPASLPPGPPGAHSSAPATEAMPFGYSPQAVTGRVPGE